MLGLHCSLIKIVTEVFMTVMGRGQGKGPFDNCPYGSLSFSGPHENGRGLCTPGNCPMVSQEVLEKVLIFRSALIYGVPCFPAVIRQIFLSYQNQIHLIFPIKQSITYRYQ